MPQQMETLTAMVDSANTMLLTNSPSFLWVVNEEKPDLLVIDLVLPEIDGLSVLSRLRQQNSEVHVIASSAFCSQQTVAAAGMLGAALFVAKPYTADSLIGISGCFFLRKRQISTRQALKIW